MTAYRKALGIAALGLSLCACGQREVRPDLPPDVLYVRIDPGIVESTQVRADVTGYAAPVAKVSLEFAQAPRALPLILPLILPMKNIGGNTWAADITPGDLRKLALTGRVGGDRIATVVAQDAAGHVTRSPQRVYLSIHAPDYTATFVD